jgi:hypothetical protein
VWKLTWSLSGRSSRTRIKVMLSFCRSGCGLSALLVVSSPLAAATPVHVAKLHALGDRGVPADESLTLSGRSSRTRIKVMLSFCRSGCGLSATRRQERRDHRVRAASQRGLDISSYWTRVRKGGTMPVGHLRINDPKPNPVRDRGMSTEEAADSGSRRLCAADRRHEYTAGNQRL